MTYFCFAQYSSRVFRFKYSRDRFVCQHGVKNVTESMLNIHILIVNKSKSKPLTTTPTICWIGHFECESCLSCFLSLFACMQVFFSFHLVCLFELLHVLDNLIKNLFVLHSLLWKSLSSSVQNSFKLDFCLMEIVSRLEP
jgi:hypothetical protein